MSWKWIEIGDGCCINLEHVSAINVQGKIVTFLHSFDGKRSHRELETEDGARDYYEKIRDMLFLESQS